MQKFFRTVDCRFPLFLLASFYLSASQFVLALPNSIVPGSGKTPVKTAEKEPTKPVDAVASKDSDAQIANATSVTTEQLVARPQDYLNKDVKFTAKFASFSSLALDYKPAFRSSRTYLSFLVFRPESHTPFSEIKLAMAVPKEKDPETHMLQTLKEGDLLEIYGKVFACPLDEPWLDVTKIKVLSSSAVKGKLAEEKDSAGDKDSDEDSQTEKTHE